MSKLTPYECFIVTGKPVNELKTGVKFIFCFFSEFKGDSMRVPLLDLRSQFSSIKDEVMPAIEEVCESQMLCLGPAVDKFEKEAASYCGCKHGIGVSSGSDALLLSLMVLGIRPGDEVITTPFTFFATAGAIARLGAKPVFVDIEEQSFNIDPNQIESAITPNTKAIIPVHLYGQMAQMGPINEIASRHGIAIVEDACQSIGAEQDGVKCGGIGDFGCFSFYPTKNLGAFGDGGLVVTNSDELNEKLRIYRNHGMNPTYFYKTIGGNFRLDGIQGAVLSVKLKHLDGWSEKRRQNAAIYSQQITATGVICPEIAPNNKSIFHQYTIRAQRRDELQKFLGDNEISSAIFYPKSLHVQQCFNYLGYKADDMPVSEKACQEVLSLPIYPELEQEQLEYVASKINEFYA